jgi:hypothetical protein
VGLELKLSLLEGTIVDFCGTAECASLSDFIANIDFPLSCCKIVRGLLILSPHLQDTQTVDALLGLRLTSWNGL